MLARCKRQKPIKYSTYTLRAYQYNIEANTIAPTFARIFKEMILIVDPEQPMIRTPKRTVQRKATIKAYEAKINSLCVPCVLLHITTYKPCP